MKITAGAGGTVAYTTDKLSAFAATTSAELAGVISDETGSGALVFSSELRHRNRIINGGFNVNQRAYVSGNAVGSGLYGHDRWKMAASGDTYTFSTTNNKTTVTIPASKVLQQVVEGINLQTGTYCLSWEGTAQGKIGAGSLSASGVTGSITGGTDTTIEFGPGTVANVQLEFGSLPTTFEDRLYTVEFSLCQRYWQNYGGSVLNLVAGSAEANVNSKCLPVVMRTTPTVTQTTPVGTGASWDATTFILRQTGFHSVDATTTVLQLSSEL